MAISHERAQIQAKINSYQDNISEYDRQIRFQKGQTTLDDVNRQKQNDRKIEIAILMAKFEQIAERCQNPRLGYQGNGLELLNNQFLDWLTPEQLVSAVYLSQEKNKFTGELITGYNSLTVDDFVKLGIDKNSIHGDSQTQFNLAISLNMKGTSIEEQESQYGAKKRAELEATTNILVLNFASNYTGNLNQHSKYGVAKPVEGAGKTGSNKVDELAKDMKNWIGNDAKIITNKSGDKVIISSDGTRRIRFDINNTSPHSNPHGHVEILVNGKWAKSGPIYPLDVPHN